jgi:hypothetical protein
MKNLILTLAALAFLIAPAEARLLTLPFRVVKNAPKTALYTSIGLLRLTKANIEDDLNIAKTQLLIDYVVVRAILVDSAHKLVQP